MPLTFLAPWFAMAGLLAAVGVVAAHLIGARTRAPVPLPTTRFVPRLQERSAAVERRPRDVLLMLLRAAALAVTGVALAGPLSAPRERAPVKIVIADLAGVTGESEILDRARLAAGDNGRVVISDSTVTVVNAAQVSETSGSAGGAASLTAALIQAIREAEALGAEGHPVELKIVSQFRQRSVDSATTAVRALWPAWIELIDVPPTREPAPARGAVAFRGEDDDPLRATAGLLPFGRGSPVVIVRGEWGAADSVSAVEGSVVVHWPRIGLPDSFTPTGSDTTGGVWVAGYTLVAPMPRDALFSGGDGARVVARWVDGRPAAVERRYDTGCVRDVAIPVPEAGDVSISPGFRRVAAALTGPCGEAHSPVPLAVGQLTALRGSGPRQAIVRPASASLGQSPLTVPLLLLAVGTLLFELGMRRWHR